MIKKKISDLLGNNLDVTGANNLERFIMGLIVLNVVSVIIEPSFKSSDVLHFFRILETVSVVIFTIEYLLRVWVSDLHKPNLKSWKARILFMASAMAIIDLLAILPFYLPFIVSVDLRVLRILRLLRLTRILKINRYTDAMTVVVTVLKNKKEQLLSSFFVALMLLVLSSVLMYNAENEAQPELFSSIIHTMWWAVATLTSVGYGDIFPVTEFGKLLAAFIAIIGTGIVAIPTGIIAAGFTEVINHKEVEELKKVFEHKEIDELKGISKQNEAAELKEVSMQKGAQDQIIKKYCPYCGNSIDEDQ